MHPNIVRSMPGMCPECGMSLIPKKKKMSASSDHNTTDKHTGHRTSSFLVKFFVSLALTIPIFIYSEMAMMVFGIQVTHFWGSQYLMLYLGSVVYFYCGLIFLTSAYRELRARLPGMMTLIALAITAAYFYSLWSIVQGVGHDLLFELSSLITIMLLGHWIEMKSVQSAQGALKELSKLLPDTAEVMRDGKTQTVPLAELISGDTVLVQPGGRVPADGTIIEGQSDLDESIITGESNPVSKKIGDEVIAGSINGDGSLSVRVDKIGEATFLAGVMRLVAEAQASKSRLQILSDRAALYLTLIAMVVGATTFAVWILVGAGVVTATERLVAVLVITCPHALGLAVPLVASISTTIAARNGFLVRQRIALEVARSVDVVLFDKTGTLTQGTFGIHTIVPFASFTENDILIKAASLNQGSEHPLAKAMIAEAYERGQTLLEIKDFKRIPGKGASGIISNTRMLVGNEALMFDEKITLVPEILGKTRALENDGKTVVFVAAGGTLIGSIALADTIREESREAIRTLHALHIRTAMITGDAPDVAAWVARELGIDEYFAQVLPHEKAEKVKLLQQKGHVVAMVGDGVNDAPALTQADLGIAIGAGTNVAIESAGIILVKNDPRDIPKIIRLSKLTYTKMIQNLFWATGYNILAIPLAAGVLASRGIILEPAVAAMLMSVSTVIVAFNALLLRRNSLNM
ncbi:MAG TPA: heavy metal translocating P-type ATPase [Candidatus Yonathbacteria bacterium]|nr:heavy metal translocating P-type ATPase [Candidatus Yonathbacteria bacterium]